MRSKGGGEGTEREWKEERKMGSEALAETEIIAKHPGPGTRFMFQTVLAKLVIIVHSLKTGP